MKKQAQNKPETALIIVKQPLESIVNRWFVKNRSRIACNVTATLIMDLIVDEDFRKKFPQPYLSIFDGLPNSRRNVERSLIGLWHSYPKVSKTKAGGYATFWEENQEKGLLMAQNLTTYFFRTYEERFMNEYAEHWSGCDLYWLGGQVPV
jgi:hypothetical protein